MELEIEDILELCSEVRTSAFDVFGNLGKADQQAILPYFDNMMKTLNKIEKNLEILEDK